MTTETYPCLDCGVDTAPCTGRRGCRHAGKWEWYMVTEAVWFAASLSKQHRIFEGMRHVYCCIGCLEKRVGRRLVKADFAKCPLSRVDTWNTARLNDRLQA